MFDNIGGKIKMLAKIVCWIGIISSLIVAAWLFYESVKQENGYHQFCAGLICLILGPLFAWIGCFVLYGFGELVENSDKMEFRTRNLNVFYERQNRDFNSNLTKRFRVDEWESEQEEPEQDEPVVGDIIIENRDSEQKE